MKYLNIIVEGSCEEIFVNDVLRKHFAELDIYVSARKITTGWDRINTKPAKGGLLEYAKFKNDVLRWIESDRKNPEFWYSSMLDLYAFPKDDQSPYSHSIQSIADPYQRIARLEELIRVDIGFHQFIPYVQLHEFEAFLMIEPEKLLDMYPDGKSAVKALKGNIGKKKPEEINESPHTSPSKRIIRYLPEYEGQKAQVGPLIAEDLGLIKLRESCPHLNDWITKLESI